MDTLEHFSTIASASNSNLTETAGKRRNTPFQVSAAQLAKMQKSHDKLEQKKISARVIAAMSSREMDLEYAPLISMQSGDLEAIEASPRMRDLRRRFLPAQTFMPQIDRTPIATSLGRYLAWRSVDEAATWPQKILMLLPVPGQYMLSTSIGSDLSEAIWHHGYHGRLAVQLSEDLFVRERERILPNLAALRDAGIRIVLTNFGIGDVSLKAVEEIGPDFIKLDRTLTKAIRARDEGFKWASATIAACRAFGIPLIADGVEDANEHCAMRDAGCELGQGRYYGVAGDLTTALFPA